MIERSLAPAGLATPKSPPEVGKSENPELAVLHERVDEARPSHLHPARNGQQRAGTRTLMKSGRERNEFPGRFALVDGSA